MEHPNNLAPELEPDLEPADEPYDEWYHDCGEDTCCCADPVENRVICGWCKVGGHTMGECKERGESDAF